LIAIQEKIAQEVITRQEKARQLRSEAENGKRQSKDLSVNCWVMSKI